jgi:hypothetical protein
VRITNTVFDDNHAWHHGGISNSGVMAVERSVFVANHARIGGAIHNTGTLTITQTTFQGNSAAPSSGGAISNGGILVLANSTFYENSSNIGGAIAHGGVSAHITNSTFYSNTAGYGGNLVIQGGSLVLHNTILAAGAGSDNCYINAGMLLADAYSLATDATCPGAMVVTLADLALGPLAANGGAPPTVALLSGSAAMNAGDDALCTAPVGVPVYGAGGQDQRGVPRPQGPHCDVGAYERVAAYHLFFPFIFQ